MKRLSARTLAIAGALAFMTLGAAISQAQERDGLAVYRSARHGFSISYPAAQFIVLPAASEDGRQFVSKDGNARLLVGNVANYDGKTLAQYRAFLLRESYAGAEVSYAPIRDTWFVLSGTRNGMLFYQRVNFVCGGRSINSWALLFPATERTTYQRIIDQVHRTYRAGTGSCA